MKERGIIMGAESIRAILAGRKVQTRRVLKPQPIWIEDTAPGVPPYWRHIDRHGSGSFDPANPPVFCPYGKPGNRLWVREGWKPIYVSAAKDGDARTVTVEYAADGAHRQFTTGEERGWQAVNFMLGDRPGYKPSLFMPRWASRLTLEIEGVRVERLQDITEEDARAEGIEPCRFDDNPLVAKLYADMPTCYPTFEKGRNAFFKETARDSYASLWDSINARRGHSWESNCWVWVLSFRVVAA